MRSIWDKDHNYCKKQAVFALLVFTGVLSLMLLTATPSLAQDEDVTVNMDQEGTIVDYSLYDELTISLTGNFTIVNSPGQYYFGIYAPEGWITSFSPEETWVTQVEEEIIPFEAEVTPSPGSAEENYTVYIWASTKDKKPDKGDLTSSSSDYFNNSTFFEVIRNRVDLISQIYSDQTLPGSTITHTFAVTNIGTTSDMFYIDLVGDDTLTSEGWGISSTADRLALEPGEKQEFHIEQEIPADAESGDYTLELMVSSSNTDSQNSQKITTKVSVPKIAEPFNFFPFLIIGFAITGAGIATFLGATEIGRLILISLFLPLYVRLKKKDVLSHFTRGEIFGYIRANPGAHYNAIIQDLGLKNGVGAYHLKVLERENYIKSVRDGIYKRFYPKDVKVPEKKVHLSRTQRDVLIEIQKHPGITQKQISKLIDESKQVVNYNVKILESAGLIRLERRGRETACFAGKVRYVEREDIHEVVEEALEVQVMHM